LYFFFPFHYYTDVTKVKTFYLFTAKSCNIRSITIESMFLQISHFTLYNNNNKTWKGKWNRFISNISFCLAYFFHIVWNHAKTSIFISSFSFHGTILKLEYITWRLCYITHIQLIYVAWEESNTYGYYKNTWYTFITRFILFSVT
jgi:hypothetical protein